MIKKYKQEDAESIMSGAADKAKVIPKDILPDYSGRGMFGDECVALVFDNLGDIAKVRKVLNDKGYSPATDNLGRDFVIYCTDLVLDDGQEERDEAIKDAAKAIVRSLDFPKVYNPGEIGRILADTLMEERSFEEDLSQECFALIIDATLQRLNDHFNRIHGKNK